MKYFPLIWAALRRKPIRTTFTFLSVTVAFTLFGLMVGLSATMALIEKKGHPDRIWVMPRFDMSGGMPVTVARQIAKMPGVKDVTVMSYIQGYVGDPKNHSGMVLLDDAYGRIFPDGPTPEQWDTVRHDHTAIIMSRNQAAQFHKKMGDTFTLISTTARADGSKVWTFRVAGIGEEVSQYMQGYIIGNYDYYDKSLPLAEQGKISEVDLEISDPAQAAVIAERIERLFANSGSPVQATPETSAYAAGSIYGGVDVSAITRKIALAGLAMILFLTASVIAKSVRERLAEFATLKTLGFSDRSVIGLVVAEAALPCLAGASFGIGIAALLTPQLPGLLPPNFAIPMPTLSLEVLLLALASALAVALISTALPILRLSRMDIAAALSGRT